MHEDLTRYLNRDVPEAASDHAERIRVGLIREVARPHLSRELGGLRGRADRPDLTQLVQEVWLKLERSQRWASRGHFLAAASRATRQVLVDEARKRSRRVRTVSIEADTQPGFHPAMPATLDGLLGELEAVEPVAARIAGFRLFGALPIAVIAEVEGISTRQVHRHWQYARAWLADRIRGDDA